MAEWGKVVRLGKREDGGVFEAGWLGVRPGTVGMAQGPLTVAALGYEPPERSVHFHLSLMSVGEDGALGLVSDDLLAEDVRAVMDAAERLATKRLTPVRGRGVDHGLVWEDGSLDLGVTSSGEAAGRDWRSVLPEGDGERILRGFIDDSLNLLSGLEFNRRRVGEGLAPLNILWPWGFGFRQALPNLALRRGDAVTVWAEDLRLEGLVRLSGYRFGEGRLRRGVHTTEEAWGRLAGVSAGVLVSPRSEEMRRLGRLEELEFEMRTMAERFLEPLWAKREAEPFVLGIFGPGVDGGAGLGLMVDSRAGGLGPVPFDERVWDDPRVPEMALWETVERVLTA